MKGSPYPVLRDRPIDQWKVTELKDELKRRKLTVKGLKEDLVKRLGEALRSEMESSNQEDVEEEEEEVENGNGDDSQQKGRDNNDDDAHAKGEDNAADETAPIAIEPLIEVTEAEALRSEMESSNQEDVEEEVENGNGDDSQQKGQDNNDDDAHAKGEDNAADETAPIAIEPLIEVTEAEGDGGVDVLVKDADDSAVGKNIEEVDVSGQSVEDDNVKISDQNIGQLAEELTHASPVMKDESVADDQSVEMSFSASENLSSEAALAVQESENEQIGNKNSDSTTKLDAEDIKPLNEEVKQVMSDLNSQNSQVSEVSPSLGFPVKNVSVSTDSISINEKNELKDNIIADDVKLELDVKHENEMVKTSSSPLVPDGGESRPMDVEEPQSKISLDETQKNVIDEDMSKKNSSADLGSPEKLNLDRSSGDDSMEEDTLENKQVDSTYNPVEVGVRVEKTDVTIVKEETTLNIEGDDLSTLREDAHVDDTVAIAASTEKRKLPDNQEALANNEPSKRQRRWKTESIKASEPQSSTPAIAMSTTPRGTPQAVGLKRSFSRSNSNADDDAPKERVVPPSEPATDSLKINNFLRPFTLKAVQELLGKTGTVTSFWMDHIKTHCYVTYSSVEEATETRNAVYNLKWPPNGGRPLVADFVDAQEVKSHIEAPPQLPSPVAPSAAPVAPLLPSPRQSGPRQKQMLQTNLPPPPPLTNPPPVRERLLPPPPPLEKVEPPAVTLDDLFRKTKATPRIYYLPLSEEQVKAKMEGQRRNSKQ